MGARIGSNLQFHRLRAGLTFGQLGEATETDHNFLYRIEKSGHTPQISLIVKLAGSLNVTCESITSGITWAPTARAFLLARSDPADREAPAVLLGHEVLRARRRFGLSQQALADRASMSRSDVGDLERGNRDFRLFTVVRIVAALEVDADELFSAVVDWYVRPSRGVAERSARARRRWLASGSAIDPKSPA